MPVEFLTNTKVQDCYTPPTKAPAKSKVPRYLYHFTTIDNLEKMQDDSFCRTSKNDPFLRKGGVFMIDLDNFLKDWNKIRVWPDITLQEALYEKISCSLYGISGITVLKVPTSELDSGKLKVRSQDTFFKMRGLEEVQNMTSEEHKHLRHGDSAELSSLYKQRHCPIEYIYQTDIPIENISVVGELTTEDLYGMDKRKINKYGGIDKRTYDIKEILLALFKGNPEEKAVEKMQT